VFLSLFNSLLLLKEDRHKKIKIKKFETKEVKKEPNKRKIGSKGRKTEEELEHFGCQIYSADLSRMLLLNESSVCRCLFIGPPSYVEKM
jgi:hypothetical protein